MLVGYSKKFQKQYKKLPKSVQNKFKKRLELFFKNQRSEILNIHKLHGNFRGLYSLNVGGDVRAVFEHVDDERVEFVAIGSHSKLYS